MSREKEQKEMIADLSHDLRTPLTAIKGYQQLLMATLAEEGQRERLRTAQKHADELGKMIRINFLSILFILISSQSQNMNGLTWEP